MRLRWLLTVIAVAVGLAGCATVYNLPLNKPSAHPLAGTLAKLSAAATDGEAVKADDETVIGLAFSGGGTRGAAFADGVLEQLARTPTRTRGDLLGHVGIISGVSGGSVLAAYYGLKGRAALSDFRKRFLDQDLMAELTPKQVDEVVRAGADALQANPTFQAFLNKM
jgi:predicted acylesterase/phospholipase RssA